MFERWLQGERVRLHQIETNDDTDLFYEIFLGTGWAIDNNIKINGRSNNKNNSSDEMLRRDHARCVNLHF